MQRPHQCDGQKAQGKVTETRRDTVDIGDIDEIVRLQTITLGAQSLPKMVHRLALQGQHEPEHESHHDGYGDDNPQEYFVDFGDCEPEECQRDRYFGNCACENIAELTQPPPLYRLE